MEKAAKEKFRIGTKSMSGLDENLGKFEDILCNAEFTLVYICEYFCPQTIDNFSIGFPMKFLNYPFFFSKMLDFIAIIILYNIFFNFYGALMLKKRF